MWVDNNYNNDNPRVRYTPKQARELHVLAESCPTPEQYEREKARILGIKKGAFRPPK